MSNFKPLVFAHFYAAANILRKSAIVLWSTTKQPHHLDVAPRLAFQPSARLYPVEVAVNVQLQQNKGGKKGAHR